MEKGMERTNIKTLNSGRDYTHVIRNLTAGMEQATFGLYKGYESIHCDGKEYLGRIIKEEDIDITLGNFGTVGKRKLYS